MAASSLDEMFWAATFPISAPQEAMRRLKPLVENSTKFDQVFFDKFLDMIVAEQSRQGVRLHKGMALYWMAGLASGSGDTKKAMELMMESFAEDVLTVGHGAWLGYAATSLRDDFGLSAEMLDSLKEFVMEKARFTFYPSSLVKSYLTEKGRDTTPKENFQGVSEESRLDSQVAQLREKLNLDLRPSIRTSPSSEAELQNAVFIILRQVDQSVEREHPSGRLAGKGSKIDFSLFVNKIGVEIKLIKERGRLRQVIDEIVSDVPFYFESLKRVLFVIYDSCGEIDDPGRVVADLERIHTGTRLLVVKH
jgi:hypothetical protein